MSLLSCTDHAVYIGYKTSHMSVDPCYIAIFAPLLTLFCLLYFGCSRLYCVLFCFTYRILLNRIIYISFLSCSVCPDANASSCAALYQDLLYLLSLLVIFSATSICKIMPPIYVTSPQRKGRRHIRCLYSEADVLMDVETSSN